MSGTTGRPLQTTNATATTTYQLLRALHVELNVISSGGLSSPRLELLLRRTGTVGCELCATVDAWPAGGARAGTPVGSATCGAFAKEATATADQ